MLWSAVSSLTSLLSDGSMVKSVPASPGDKLLPGQHLLCRQGEEFESKGFTFGFVPSLQYKLQAVSLLHCCLEQLSASQHGRETSPLILAVRGDLPLSHSYLSAA